MKILKTIGLLVIIMYTMFSLVAVSMMAMINMTLG